MKSIMYFNCNLLQIHFFLSSSTRLLSYTLISVSADAPWLASYVLVSSEALDEVQAAAFVVGGLVLDDAVRSSSFMTYVVEKFFINS